MGFDEQVQERLSKVVQRYGKINGWGVQEILDFLERHLIRLELESTKQTYITVEEQLKCQRVADAFTELEDAGITVLDAGRYGFLRLVYYQFPYGFDDAITYVDSMELFNDLWEDWLQEQMHKIEEDNPSLGELDYEDIFKFHLSKEEQDRILSKKVYFAQRAGIQL